MKTFKFSLMLRTRENMDVFISLNDNIYGIHSKRVNILYVYLRCIDTPPKEITLTRKYFQMGFSLRKYLLPFHTIFTLNIWIHQLLNYHIYLKFEQVQFTTWCCN